MTTLSMNSPCPAFTATPRISAADRIAILERRALRTRRLQAAIGVGVRASLALVPCLGLVWLFAAY